MVNKVQLPPVGTLVEVLVEAPRFFKVWGGSTVGYIPEPRQTYVDRITANGPEDVPGTFRMSTDIRHFPERVITLADVVRLRSVAQQQGSAGKRSEGSSERPNAGSVLHNAAANPTETTKPDEVWRVKSSRGEAYYEVIRRGRSWQCTCPGFTYHRGKCRHLDKVMAERQKAS